MDSVESYTVSCPYCGESFETSIDTSAGSQDYVEDCYVCCRPIQFVVSVGFEGQLSAVETRRDDD